MKRLMQTTGAFLLCIAFLAGLLGCGKKVLNLRAMSPEEQFEYAKSIFDKKDYLKAKTQMMMVVMNNQGNVIVEKAQFYLAESYYGQKEYLIAVEEYEKLIRSMPRSEYVDDARYKTGMCYYRLSPSYGLDQDYTHKAIYQFQTFLEEFPDSDLKPEVEARLSECRNKLGKKVYKEGEQWRKMGYYRSAILSFNQVIDRYYDTEFLDDAIFWKGDCHMKLEEWEEARTAFQSLLDRNSGGKWEKKMNTRMKKIQKKGGSS